LELSELSELDDEVFDSELDVDVDVVASVTVPLLVAVAVLEVTTLSPFTGQP
jgi:hypothetical protein